MKVKAAASATRQKSLDMGLGEKERIQGLRGDFNNSGWGAGIAINVRVGSLKFMEEGGLKIEPRQGLSEKRDRVWVSETKEIYA